MRPADLGHPRAARALLQVDPLAVLVGLALRAVPVHLQVARAGLVLPVVLPAWVGPVRVVGVGLLRLIPHDLSWLSPLTRQ